VAADPQPPGGIEGVALPAVFYRAPGPDVAPRLLNKVLVAGGCAGRIVEVEAYTRDDPASHAFRGETARNQVMFGPPGHLYVYFSYGMHWCANAVCGDVDEATAVLIRALAPLAGLAQMGERRPRARRERDLCSGPAKLCQALGLTGTDNGRDLTDARSPVRILDDGTPPPLRPGRSARIGISVATETPWRWYVDGDPNVSR
jgi:DNA-3-methyladenine glycosylase